MELASKIAESRFSYYTFPDIAEYSENVERLMKFCKRERPMQGNKEFGRIAKKVTRTTYRLLLSYLEPRLVTVDMDDEPVDWLFREEKYVVCRHYTKTVVEIYKVLQSLNPKLTNTYVSEFKTRDDHIWNQASSVSPIKGGVRIDVAFFDPTFSDTGGSWEALDASHIGGRHRDAFDGMLRLMLKDLSGYDFKVDLSDVPKHYR